MLKLMKFLLAQLGKDLQSWNAMNEVRILIDGVKTKADSALIELTLTIQVLIQKG